MIGPHINTIIALTTNPMRADTKVSAPKIRLAPMVAKSTPIQYDIETSPKENQGTIEA